MASCRLLRCAYSCNVTNLIGTLGSPPWTHSGTSRLQMGGHCGMFCTLLMYACSCAVHAVALYATVLNFCLRGIRVFFGCTLAVLCTMLYWTSCCVLLGVVLCRLLCCARLRVITESLTLAPNHQLLLVMQILLQCTGYFGIP